MTAYIIVMILGLVAVFLWMAISRRPESDLPQLLQRGQFAEVLRRTFEELKDDPKHVALRVLRGQAAVMAGEFDLALESFQIAARLDPRDPTAAEGVALAMAYAGRSMTEACELMEKTRQSLPAIQEFQGLAVAFLLLKSGDREAALREFADQRELLETRFELDYTDQDATLAETLYHYAILAAEAGDEDAAEQLFSRVRQWGKGTVFERWSESARR